MDGISNNQQLGVFTREDFTEIQNNIREAWAKYHCVYRFNDSWCTDCCDNYDFCYLLHEIMEY